MLAHRFQRLVAIASEGRWQEVLECLDDLSDGTKEEKSSLLMQLAEFGKTAWIRPLIEIGADLRYRDETGETALGKCLSGSARGFPTFMTAARLLDAGADPNELTRGGNRILQLAIAENRPEFVTLLLLNGADPTLSSPDPDEPNAFDTAKSLGSSRGWATALLRRWERERHEAD